MTEVEVEAAGRKDLAADTLEIEVEVELKALVDKLELQIEVAAADIGADTGAEVVEPVLGKLAELDVEAVVAVGKAQLAQAQLAEAHKACLTCNLCCWR